MNKKHVNLNQVFTITLEGNPSTGYVWKYEPVDGITLTNQIHEPRSKENLVGGPVLTTFFFRVDKVGDHQLKLVKVRPWEKTTPAIQTYEEIISVS